MGAFDFLRTDRNFAGHWDPSDSTIDWCEINYVYTFYIAEMVNTMTNIPQIACNISLAKKTYNSGVPSRYALVYISSMIIGIGSFGFHGTLRWTWQLLDEFPMVRERSSCADCRSTTRP
jgi:dihydroceramidase